MEWNYLREILLNRHRDRGFVSVGEIIFSIDNALLSGRQTAA